MRRDKTRGPGGTPGALILTTVAVSAAMLLALASCGGGTPEPSIVYTGVTTEATVTGGNATEVAQTAYRGGTTGASLGGLASVSGGGDASGGGRPGHLSMALVVAKALEGVTITPAAPTDATVLLVTTDTVSGFCSPSPGSLFYRINHDDSSGVFFGTMQFFSYCFDGVSLTGSASITGRVAPLSLLFQTLDITFDSLTAVSSGDSFTGSGSMSYD